MEKWTRKCLLGLLLMVAVELSWGRIVRIENLDKDIVKGIELFERKLDEENFDEKLNQPLYKKHPKEQQNNKNKNKLKDDWVKVSISSDQKQMDNETREIEVFEGSSVVLNCDISGHPLVEADWIERGEYYESDDSRKDTDFEPSSSIVEAPFVNMQMKYVIDCAELKHSGSYTCQAKGGNAKMESTVHLKVVRRFGRKKRCHQRRKPIITEYFKSIVAPQADTIVLPCLTKSQSDDVIWILPNEKNMEKISQNENDNSLIIKDISFEEMGVYKCIALFGNYMDIKSSFVYPFKRRDEDKLKMKINLQSNEEERYNGH